MSRVFRVEYDPEMPCAFDKLACFIVSESKLDYTEIEDAIAHPNGDITINEVMEITIEQLEYLEVPKRVIYLYNENSSNPHKRARSQKA